MIKNNLLNKRLLWPDAVRAISIFLVILIHVSANTTLFWENQNKLNWMVGNVFNSFARISVPLFVILSGSLLLQKNDKLQSFFKKRFMRIIYPWFFWGTINLFFNNYFGFVKFSNFDFKVLIINNYLGGFWFMPMLVGIYLVTPFIKPFIQKANKIELSYFFMLWFIISSVIPTLNKVFGISLSINLPVWLSYLGYFVGGYYINKKINLNKETIKKALYSFIISFFTILIGSLILTINNNQFTDYLYEYLSVPVVFMSFSGFILLKNYFEKVKLSKKLINTIRFFSDNSFGIFLCHVMLIRIFETGFLGFKLSSNSFNPIVSIPFITIVVFIVSAVLVSNLKKISLLKKFAG